MRPRYWLDVSSVRRVVIVVAAVAVLAVFWQTVIWPALREIPQHSNGIAASRYAKRMVTHVVLICGSWLFGWCLVLFVRAEDTTVLAPYDYQAVVRVVGWLVVASSVILASLFAFVYHESLIAS